RQTLEATLAEGPATYLELMAALGTRDGREILRDFDKLYQQGRLKRLKDGRYALNGGAGSSAGGRLAAGDGETGISRPLFDRIVVARHQILDQLVELTPIGFAVRVVPDDEGGAGIEFFVLQVAAGKLATHHVPCQLEQLHARNSVGLRRLPIGRELPGEVGVVHDRDVSRHLEHAAAAELAQLVDEFAVVLRAPVESRIHETAIEADVTLRPMLAGVDLPVHQAANRALDRGHFAERFPDGGNLIGAGRLCNFAAETEQEAHLRPVAHVRLVISEAMARRLDVDFPRESGFVVHEHLLPRHLDVIAQHHAVAFIVAPREWGIEFRCGAEHCRLARPESETRRVARYSAGDRLFLLIRREWKHVADP